MSDLEIFREAHKHSDMDLERYSMHHSLGDGPTQASPGNHNHDGVYSPVDHNHDTLYQPLSWRTLKSKIWLDTAAQVIATGIAGLGTAIAFNAEELDPSNWHDNAINNTRMTVSQTGRYEFIGQVAFATSAVGIRQLSVVYNSLISVGTINQAGVTGANTLMNIKGTVPMVAGDYLELRVHQNTGGNLNVNVGQYSTFLYARYIGDI